MSVKLELSPLVKNPGRKIFTWKLFSWILLVQKIKFFEFSIFNICFKREKFLIKSVRRCEFVEKQLIAIVDKNKDETKNKRKQISFSIGISNKRLEELRDRYGQRIFWYVCLSSLYKIFVILILFYYFVITSIFSVAFFFYLFAS